MTAPGAGTNWSRVEQLFHDARELPPDQRGDFLARACDGDPALQRDVESLLAQEDGPLLGGGVQTLARGMTRGMTDGSREGSHLGPYVLGPLLGEGGMGEVYRARDPRLGREVAIKLLPPELASDPDRLRRLEREARVLASLSHPNIATLFGIEEQDGVTGLVLELVPGVTLRQHLAASGPKPLDEALAIARQIAVALDAAHQHGIVHRDLKPANIVITPDGAVKVLDFGLARINAAGAAGPDGAEAVTGVTVTAVTVPGRILGTPAYMSPEQARGAAADRRADIWAFGCVLFEMLTGEQVFHGESVADTIGAVIHRDPALDRLPSSTPPHIRATIERCLQKDARDRARDISDVRLALEGAFSGPAVAAPVVSARPAVRWLTVAALVGALLTGALGWSFTTSRAVDAPSMRFRVSPPEGLRFGRIALSPDGRSLAFTDSAEGRSGLWVYSFETGESRHLERAGQFTNSMFWSPDSKSIGFLARGAVHRISIDGTQPQQITTVERFGGAQWLGDGTILMGSVQGGIVKVPLTGGPSVAVTELDAARNETGHTGPVMLPDGRRFLYVRQSRTPQQSGVFVGSVDRAPAEQPTRAVLTPAAQPFLSASADGGVHMLFVRNGELLAQALDLDSMTLSGPTSVVAERIGTGLGGSMLVSAAGSTIATRPPEAPGGGVPVWFNRDGSRAGPVFETSTPPLVFPQLSPDGTRLAANVSASGLWVFPLDGRPPIRLTTGGSLSPRWTPDGQSIVYERSGASAGLHAVAADGSSAAPRPVGPSGHFHPHGFLPGGGVLALFELPRPDASWSLVEVPWSGAGAPARLGDFVLPPAAASAALSPDGRWLAYIANTTGQAELWVRRFPGLDGAVRVSSNGAVDAVWAKDGRELFYLEGDTLMRVRVLPATSGRFNFDPPVRVMEKLFLAANQPPWFDVAADGRLLLLERLPPQPPAAVEVTVNWAPKK